MGKITFIATVFNEEASIVQLLESLKKQTKKADEIIIVDAGSRDGTVSLINEFIQNNKKQNVLLLKKKGNRSVGRNTAIKKARGDIIIASDAGCTLKCDWIEKITRPFLYNIETKLNEKDYTREEVLEYARVMADTIEEANAVKQATVQSFVLEVLPEIKRINPEIKTSALFAPSKFDYLLLSFGFSSPGNSIIEKTKQIKAEIISPYYEYINAKFIHSCRESKIKVIPWTVNDKELMKKLMQIGVDGIISDYPDRLKSVHLEKINE
jgi:glycosyltransferase involved in cell wall biosynthesis